MAKSTSDIEREIRQALSQCKVSARGLWHEMRHLIETESDRPGHLQRNGRPVSDDQLALAAGCSSKRAAQLLQDLIDVGLVERSGAFIHAPRLARIAEVRSKRSDLTRKWRNRGCRPLKRRRKNHAAEASGSAAPAGVSRDTNVDPDVNPLVTALKTRPPAPALSLPPGTPLSNPPTTPVPNAAHSVPAAGENAVERGEAGGEGTKKPGKKREPKLSPDQRLAWDGFRDWWTFDAWPARHNGVVYEFESSRDGKAVMRILESQNIDFDLAKAQRVAQLFLDEDDLFLAKRGRTIFDFADRLRHYLSRLALLDKVKGKNHGTTGSGTNGQQQHAGAGGDSYAIPDSRRHATRADRDASAGRAGGIRQGGAAPSTAAG